MFGNVTGIETDVFNSLLMLKAGTMKPSEPELRSLFERYYKSLESLEKTIDDLHV